MSALQRGVVGRLGIERDMVMHQGREAYVVRGFRPWSRAGESGLRVGDVVVPERWYDMSRTHAVDETVAVRVVRGSQTLHLQLPTTPRPIDLKTKLHFVVNALLCSLGTVIGLVIGLRQAERKTSRALALAFLCWSMNLGSSYAAPHWPQAIIGVANTAMLLPGWYLVLRPRDCET